MGSPQFFQVQRATNLGSVQFCDCRANLLGGWLVHGSVTTGVSSHAHNVFVGHHDWRNPDYQPYAGDGIYRGTIATAGIASFEISASGKVANFKQLTPPS